MGYRLVPFTAEWEPAVARCNARLKASGAAPFLLPQRATEFSARGPLQRQHWLAVGDEGEVHGGCLIQSQPGWAGGEAAEIVNIQSPLSEGLADKRHGGLALWMLRDILSRHPLAYSVGMGSAELPYPRLLKALRWRVEPVPFYFRVLAGRRLLANLQPLRGHARFGVFARIGGWIPLLPDAAFSLLHSWRSARPARDTATGKPDWTRIRERYGFAIDRSAEMLAALYPEHDSRFRRFRVQGGLGVLSGSRFRGHPYFGNLFVATLAEAICEPGAERPLLRAAVNKARSMSADLLLTNQTAPEVLAALKDSGWLSYRSNYLLGIAPALAARIGEKPVYVTRGDGDGLLNL